MGFLEQFITNDSNQYTDWVGQFKKEGEQNNNQPANYQRDWVANPPSNEELIGMTTEELGQMYAGRGIKNFDADRFADLYGGSRPEYDPTMENLVDASMVTAGKDLRGQATKAVQGVESNFMTSGTDEVQRKEAKDIHENQFMDLVLSGDVKRESIYTQYRKELQDWFQWLTSEDVFTSEYWDDIAGGGNGGGNTTFGDPDWADGSEIGETKESRGRTYYWNGSNWSLSNPIRDRG